MTENPLPVRSDSDLRAHVVEHVLPLRDVDR
jgi:hypothetical protein